MTELEEVKTVERLVPQLKGKSKLPKSGKKNGPLSPETARGLINALKERLDQDGDVIEAAVLAGVAGLPVLFLGPHGSGKTTLVKNMAKCLYINGKPAKFRYINVKEGHTEFTIFARPNYAALLQGREEWVAKAVAADVPFFDEVFRNFRVFSAFNESLEEGTFEGLRVNWKMVFAATNPPSEWYRNVSLMNWADLDRFAVHIPLSDHDLDWTEKMAEGVSLEVDARIDIANIEDVRRQINGVKVSDEARALAILMVGAFSACPYKSLTDKNLKYETFNKFEFGQMPCFDCKFQRHQLCPRYALAPKRSLRSLLALARANPHGAQGRGRPGGRK